MWQVVRQVLAQAWQQFAGQSLAVLPNVLAGLLFLMVGIGLTVVAGGVAGFLLRRSAIERSANRIGLTAWLERAGVLSATAALVRLVQAVCVLMTAALFLYALDATLAGDLTKRFFRYLPDLAIGIVIFVAGVLVSRMVGRRTLIGAVNRGLPATRLLATLARGGIIVITSAIALDHLGIGRAIVPSALLILLGGVTLASALAVGLGGRDAVSRWIDERLAHHSERESDGIQHW